jgi:hypothetical protein
MNEGEFDLYDMMLANARAGKPAYVLVGEQSGPAARMLVETINRVVHEVGHDVTVTFKPAQAENAASPSLSAAGSAPFSGASDLAAGVWVVRMHDASERPTFGRILHAYDMDGTAVLDIVLYANDGRRVGGATPESGGEARPCEPACRADRWEPIDQPDFDFLGGVSSWGSFLKRLRPVAKSA